MDVAELDESVEKHAWPIVYWRDGLPQRTEARWWGRGLARELGPRAFGALLRARGVLERGNNVRCDD